MAGTRLFPKHLCNNNPLGIGSIGVITARNPVVLYMIASILCDIRGVKSLGREHLPRSIQQIFLARSEWSSWELVKVKVQCRKLSIVSTCQQRQKHIYMLHCTLKPSATRLKTTDRDNNDYRYRPLAPHPSRLQQNNR